MDCFFILFIIIYIHLLARQNWVSMEKLKVSFHFFFFDRGIAGDLFIIFHVSGKQGIWRDGLHLYSKINVDYTQAILGTTLKVIIINHLMLDMLQFPASSYCWFHLSFFFKCQTVALQLLFSYWIKVAAYVRINVLEISIYKRYSWPFSNLSSLLSVIVVFSSVYPLYPHLIQLLNNNPLMRK